MHASRSILFLHDCNRATHIHGLADDYIERMDGVYWKDRIIYDGFLWRLGQVWVLKLTREMGEACVERKITRDGQ